MADFISNKYSAKRTLKRCEKRIKKRPYRGGYFYEGELSGAGGRVPPWGSGRGNWQGPTGPGRPAGGPRQTLDIVFDTKKARK
jgi:hypothetical protein